MSRTARHCRIRIDPHCFEASPEMLASDDDLAMAHHGGETDEACWWSEFATEARARARRETSRRGKRAAGESAPE